MIFEDTCTFDEWSIRLANNKEPTQLTEDQLKIVEFIRKAAEQALKVTNSQVAVK